MTELADIFRAYGPAYRQKFAEQLLPSHRVAMQAIEQCRTAALGGHVYDCKHCRATDYSYHSCQNRHCPKCQQQTTEQWLARQQDFLLPSLHFMVTFTLPAQLRAVVRSNQKLLYNLLFRTSAAALQQLARDPRFVGGQIGMIGLLHTWGRNLSFHPHVHYLVPAGGLAADGQTWLPSRHNFLLPGEPLSILFRAKFRDALKKTKLFNLVPAETWRQSWVVHCKPVGTGQQTLDYLGRYLFRVAISNQRIEKLQNGRVTFRFKDTATAKTKRCTLSAQEFIRRFLQHVLPKGFVKVRYYGFFSPGQRQTLHKIRQGLVALQLATAQPQSTPPPVPNPTSAAPEWTCPQCGRPMRLVGTLAPQKQGRPP